MVQNGRQFRNQLPIYRFYDVENGIYCGKFAWEQRGTKAITPKDIVDAQKYDKIIHYVLKNNTMSEFSKVFLEQLFVNSTRLDK